MSKTTKLTERNRMMAYVLKSEGLLIPSTNGAGERVYVLTEDMQNALEGMHE